VIFIICPYAIDASRVEIFIAVSIQVFIFLDKSEFRKLHCIMVLFCIVFSHDFFFVLYTSWLLVVDAGIEIVQYNTGNRC
jgi:hypothetical protein